VDRPALSATALPRGRTWLERFVGAPRYEAAAADRETFNLAGLELPIRATVAISVVTVVLLFDFSRTFIPHIVQDLGRAPEAMRYQALERVILFGFVPLAVVLLLFRDSPMRYGVRLGDWRWGLGLAIAGCVVMTPIVLVLASVPHFRDYYGLSSADAGYVAVTNILELVPAEFLIRGFLMFTLLRAIGPLGVLVATLPFVFAHLGKPEIELFSTLAGGLLYGWFNWRTGPIVWSAAAHVYIVTLMVVAAGS